MGAALAGAENVSAIEDASAEVPYNAGLNHVYNCPSSGCNNTCFDKLFRGNEHKTYKRRALKRISNKRLFKEEMDRNS